MRQSSHSFKWKAWNRDGDAEEERGCPSKYGLKRRLGSHLFILTIQPKEDKSLRANVYRFFWEIIITVQKNIMWTLGPLPRRFKGQCSFQNHNVNQEASKCLCQHVCCTCVGPLCSRYTTSARRLWMKVNIYEQMESFVDCTLGWGHMQKSNCFVSCLHRPSIFLQNPIRSSDE